MGSSLIFLTVKSTYDTSKDSSVSGLQLSMIYLSFIEALNPLRSQDQVHLCSQKGIWPEQSTTSLPPDFLQLVICFTPYSLKIPTNSFKSLSLPWPKTSLRCQLLRTSGSSKKGKRTSFLLTILFAFSLLASTLN